MHCCVAVACRPWHQEGTEPLLFDPLWNTLLPTYHPFSQLMMLTPNDLPTGSICWPQAELVGWSLFIGSYPSVSGALTFLSDVAIALNSLRVGPVSHSFLFPHIKDMADIGCLILDERLTEWMNKWKMFSYLFRTNDKQWKRYGKVSMLLTHRVGP